MDDPRADGLSQEHMMSKYFSPAPSCLLSVLFCTSLVLISCSQATVPATHTSVSSADPVTAWIRQNALPLKTTDPASPDADLLPLEHLVGNASMVGLGEETHGTHEFFTMRARLTEFLITHMGFTTFIMENDWGMSQLIDGYINGGQTPIALVMKQGLFRSWQTEEYRSLLEWMRAYNAAPTHSAKIHFLGMDCQGVSQSDFDAVENSLHTVDPQQVAAVHKLYADIVTNSLPDWTLTYPGLSSSTKQRLVDQAQHAYDLLKSHQQLYQHRSSFQAFALALHTARIIVQFTTYHNATTEVEQAAHYLQRDAFMAENVAWIHDYAAGKSPKMIVWAHDQHIANDTSYEPLAPLYTNKPTENMGGFLRKQFQGNYLAVGTSLYEGTFTSYTTAYQPQQSLIQTPGKDTYNYTLGNVGLPLYLLDLRRTPLGPVTTWANGPHLFPVYGLGSQSFSSSGSLKSWFDLIIPIRETHAAHSLLN